MILEFGNMEHIKLAEKGIICECGHAKTEHDCYGNCQEKDINGNEVRCECECGDTHWATKDCDCSKFKIKM